MTQNKEYKSQVVKDVHIRGKISERFSGLGLTKFDLGVIENILENNKELLINPMKNYNLYAIIWSGIIVRYTACFGSSQSRTKLISNNVYSQESGLRHSYSIVEDIRNKSIAHDVNSSQDDKSILKLGKNNEIIGVDTMLVAFTLRSDFYDMIKHLVKIALEFVQVEMNTCGKKLIEEAQAMTPEQRGSLLPWSYDAMQGMFDFREPRMR